MLDEMNKKIDRKQLGIGSNNYNPRGSNNGNGNLRSNINSKEPMALPQYSKKYNK
jgi:hypothetical protein